MVMLEGSTTVNPGGTVTFNIREFGKIHFDLDSVEIHKAPSLPASSTGMLGRAGNDAEKRMEAAQWALRHGLLPQFYEAVDKALEVNPQHPRAMLVKQLKAKMDVRSGRLVEARAGDADARRPQRHEDQAQQALCADARHARHARPAASSRGPTSGCSF